jgi:histidinol dehydrogenase
MTITHNPERQQWSHLTARPVESMASIEPRVEPVLNAVRTSGDEALRELTAKFDGVEFRSANDFRVSDEEFACAEAATPDALKAAIHHAKENIETFHATQHHAFSLEAASRTDTRAGVTCWRKSVAIERVGLYIPGGTAPLFSTLLMLGVPSSIAGCKTRVLCTPPSTAFQEEYRAASGSGSGSVKGSASSSTNDATGGWVHPAILYTAQLVGIREVFKIGGAQAVAAMAFGTGVVPRVDKIFGPGNQYVTVAKQLVQKQGVAIDMPAGPSEVCVLADETCVPAFVAADLLSQAEHGTDSQVLLVASSASVVESVLRELDRQVESLPRRTIAEAALRNSRAVVLPVLDDAIDFVNDYAAEHLIIACADTHRAEAIAERITQAGSVFIGNFSPEAAGDYASGTNHTLPTNGYARAYSGVSLDSFVKKITFQRLSQSGLQTIGAAVATMAHAEGLEAHKRAVTIRLEE